MIRLILVLLFPLATLAQKITTKVESSGFKETPTYYEIIDWWKKIDQASVNVKMVPMGPSDAGFPLHLIFVNSNGEVNPKNFQSKGKTVILINNGIHPGEPDGIDASMMLVRDIVEGKKRLPVNVILAIIPVYNIGGC
ncbi:MAG: hypothetical protein ACXWV5_07330, partial [Flavitalea sp.]